MSHVIKHWLFVELILLCTDNNGRIYKIFDPVRSAFGIEGQIPVHPSTDPVV